MLEIILITSLFCLLSVSVVEAGVVGGLNTVNENQSWYYDLTAPNVTINSPTGTVTSTTISLSTTIEDVHSTNCTYWVNDEVGSPVKLNTTFDCVSTSFTIFTNANYNIYVNADDGKFENTTSGSFTLNYVPSATGSGGGATIIKTVGTAEQILDFGTQFLTLTVLSTPSDQDKTLIVKNLGDLDIKKAKLKLSDTLKPYLDIEFCDNNFENCGSNVDLEAGETGFILINGNYDSSLGKGVEGLLTVEGDQIHELAVKIDRPPLYGIYSSIAHRLNISEIYALMIVYLFFLGGIYVTVQSTLKGGVVS